VPKENPSDQEKKFNVLKENVYLEKNCEQQAAKLAPV